MFDTHIEGFVEYLPKKYGEAGRWRAKHVRHDISIVRLFFSLTLLLSSLTHRRFYPLRSSSGQAVVAGAVPSLPRYVPFIFIAHRIQCSHYLVDVHRMLLTYALALSAG